MSFGSQLKIALSNRGITQRDLAFMCDITESNISRWCMDKTSPHIQDVVKICKTLNCSADWLLEIK